VALLRNHCMTKLKANHGVRLVSRVRVSLIKGVTHSRDNLTLEIVQVLKEKGLLRIAAPSDGYLKRLVFTAASLNSL
jgi:hypothetical protein